MTAKRPPRPVDAKTLGAMIRIFCRGNHHQRHSLCGDCAYLLAYARERIAECPWGENKPVCSQCPVHCYEDDMRDRVIAVMRYSGPRMALRHPLLALFHRLKKTDR